MMNQAEEKVSLFYNTVGWETDEEITEDARRWEDLREHSRDYVSKCRRRVLDHIPDMGENMLDMASGPIQYAEYLEYSRNFKKRFCVDLSSGALEGARKKIGDHGVFLHGSFFDIPLEESLFDCAVSLHTIYHIDKDKQEDAVRKLIRVTKPGRPVIIVYSNPDTVGFLFGPSLTFRVYHRIRRLLKKRLGKNEKEEGPSLYFYSHPIKWWDRFKDTAKVEILPWRSFTAEVQKRLIPNNQLGARILALLFSLEDRFPDFFMKHFEYPMIIITKKS